VTRVALEIPKVGLVMENARIVRWLKRIGDQVRQGEPLLELETEKSVVEIEAAHSGRLVQILLQADAEAHVGDRIAWLDSDAPEAAAAAPGAPAGAARETGVMEPARADVVRADHSTLRVKSSPVARRLAAEHGVNLSHVTGTGPRGRVQMIDVRQAVESRARRDSCGEPVSTGARPLSSMRRAVARSMTLSNATVPQFTVERAVDWSALQKRRMQLLSALPPGAVRPSVNDFLLQAIARTLLGLPALNATFSGDPDSPTAALLPANGAHIGLVVAVDDGLLVPVLHGVERFGILELAQQRSEIVQRALQGKLRREELGGATFSLSNLGARGPDRFSALVNPPQSAILAVGRQRNCVVALGGGFHVRPMSELTLSVDHRVADGRLGAEFLNLLVEILEGDGWR